MATRMAPARKQAIMPTICAVLGFSGVMGISLSWFIGGSLGLFNRVHYSAQGVPINHFNGNKNGSN